MDEACAFDDFSDGLQFEVWSHGWSLAGDETFLGDEVLASGGEAVGEEGLDAHACLRESGGVLVAPVRLLYVFSEGELDARRGFHEKHSIGG